MPEGAAPLPEGAAPSQRREASGGAVDALAVGASSEVSLGRPRGLTRLLGFLFKPWGRAATAGLWLALVASGGLVAKGFLGELVTTVPPVPGTLSYKAAEAIDRFFPIKSVSNAVLVQSRDKKALVRFVEGSTCELKSNLDLAGGGLRLTCSNDTALGGGCIRTKDLIPELDAIVRDLVNKSEAFGLINKTQGDEAISLFETLGPGLIQKELPNITHCPLPGDGTLTQDWIGIVEDLNRTLLTQFPQCQHTLASFLSAPEKTVEKTISVPSPFNASQQMNVTLSATIPAGALWDLFRTQLLTEDGGTMLIAALTSSCNGKAVTQGTQEDKDVANAIQKLTERAPPSLLAKVSSQSLMMDAIQNGITETMDLSTKTMPVALLILAAMAGNVRLLICTLVNLLACLAVAFLFMYPIAKNVTVSTTSPSMMVAVALGMSIDYSLFLLTRFQKEVDAGRPAERAAEIMLGTSGKIVLVSGLTLLLCFLMMLILPASFIATMGVSASLTVFTAIAAALTLTPTLLLTFPSFFGSSRSFGFSADGCCCCPRRQRTRTLSSGPMENLAVQLQNGNSEIDHTEALNQRMATSWWPKYGKGVQKFSLPILLALVAVAVPFGALSLPRLGYSAGLVPFMPADADATHAVLTLLDAFGSGALFPTTLLVQPKAELVATDDARRQWLADACEALRTVAQDVNTDPSVPPFTPGAFMGVMMINGKCSSLGVGSWSTVGGPYSATEVTISYAVDPFSTEGQAWFIRMRDALDKHTDIATWYLAGEGPNQMDAANETFKTFPFMILLMMVVVLVLIGISFKSVIAPFRAVFCLLWMLVVTFGAAVYVFQDGALDFLDWGQLGQRGTGAMSWMSPMISCSVIVGLGLDYDIFYTEGVLEECEHGHSETDAAIRALTDTANTISAAGLIMVIAFGSLLLCSTPTLNEIAFLLIVGILIDCFITTKVIMPAAMYWLGRLNFWPHKFKMAAESPRAHRGRAIMVVA